MIGFFLCRRIIMFFQSRGLFLCLGQTSSKGIFFGRSHLFILFARFDSHSQYKICSLQTIYNNFQYRTHCHIVLSATNPFEQILKLMTLVSLHTTLTEQNHIGRRGFAASLIKNSAQQAEYHCIHTYIQYLCRIYVHILQLHHIFSKSITSSVRLVVITVREWHGVNSNQFM